MWDQIGNSWRVLSECCVVVVQCKLGRRGLFLEWDKVWYLGIKTQPRIKHLSGYGYQRSVGSMGTDEGEKSKDDQRARAAYLSKLKWRERHKMRMSLEDWVLVGCKCHLVQKMWIFRMDVRRWIETQEGDVTLGSKGETGSWPCSGCIRL